MSGGSGKGGGEAGQGERSFLPRWAWWLLLPGLLAPVAIVAFMAYAQLAHDEDRCPFERKSMQAVGEARVLEEARECIRGTQERRYTLQRGEQAQLLGERRLPSTSFASGRYRWQASTNERGEVQVLVHHADHGDVIFREGTVAERAGGPLIKPKRPQ